MDNAVMQIRRLPLPPAKNDYDPANNSYDWSTTIAIKNTGSPPPPPPEKMAKVTEVYTNGEKNQPM